MRGKGQSVGIQLKTIVLNRKCSLVIFDISQVSFEYVQGSVPYRPPWAALSSFGQTGHTSRKENFNVADETSSGGKNFARLYPNVRGCGYPPELNCEDFFEKFGGLKNDTASSAGPYPCWVSTIDSTIAMTELDLVSERASLRGLIACSSGQSYTCSIVIN